MGSMTMTNFVQVNTQSHMARAKPVGYVIQDNGCWIWQGAKHYKGYGLWNHRKAHRVMYETHIGPIPDGLVLDHFACDNPSCVNPAHVRPVTSRENTLRGNTLAARELAQTHCCHGHPLVEGNLRANKNEPRKRRCLTCKRIAAAKAYALKRQGP